MGLAMNLLENGALCYEKFFVCICPETCVCHSSQLKL